MTDEDDALSVIWQVYPTKAKWQVYTYARTGVDLTTVRFSSIRNANTLEWEQSTFSGQGGTVFIDRVATGLVWKVKN
ncbi:hypothetical protein [Rhodococcoides kroppenstedtii]|uniref:hypothetical protein n=1 Tax=Rhodococcoides kroppenstedtii TaxID=293050 RepID=UPI001427E4B7|nr:hypothetical protein [Rhodococcus kroppenstedtii]NIL81052.1 hypothetical protein [Rhodococcus kroppenstedtii]